MLKPVPPTVACESVTLPVPVLVSVTVLILLWATRTVPKFTLGGLAESSGVTPEPKSATAVGKMAASLTTETVPAKLPASLGANVTLNEALRPATRVSGKGGLARLNPPLVKLA